MSPPASVVAHAPQIETALALVLTERDKPGDKTRAIELCKRALLFERSPLTYWVLARAEQGGKSDWAMAEFYNMNGDKSSAQKYAKRAQSQLPTDAPEYIKSGDLLNPLR
jgi:predicted Zn-dependent protease